mmetsp:Transcript_9510/g.12465  ORF Transcript_9510/g.12465 Transcript_9510/m.12465 type:complete len:350 (+) Transcript_9510:242-1291(+)
MERSEDQIHSINSQIKVEDQVLVKNEEEELQNLVPDTIPKCFSSDDSSSLLAQRISFARHDNSNYCMRGSFLCNNLNMSALNNQDLPNKSYLRNSKSYLIPNTPSPATSLLPTSLEPPANAVDERKKRSRERNRLHAKKTRERKKMQMQALQLRIKQLQKEEDNLRRMLEERDTAQALLCMSGKSSPSSNEDHPEIKYNDNLEAVLLELQKLDGFAALDTAEGEDPDGMPKKSKAKLSVQERQRIRRERNRMHAKRTRDRKKLFFEASALIIQRMEIENTKLCKQLGIERPTAPTPEASQADVEKVLAELADGPLTMKKLKRMTAKEEPNMDASTKGLPVKVILYELAE